MGRGSKKKKSSQFSMDEDDAAKPSSTWMTGPAEGAAADEMDTREAGHGDGDASVAGDGLTKKERQGKRGNRSNKQKKRKAVKMERALSVAGKRETKHTKQTSASVSKKSLKSLWVAGKAKR